jgi:rod shape-determining protein MreC
MAFALLSLFIMAADYRKEKTQPLHTALNIVTYPLQVIVDLPSRITHSLGDFFATHKTLAGENQEYRKQIEYYAAQQQMFQSIKSENEALRRQLKAKNKVYSKFSMADILNIASDNFRHETVINSGQDKNLFIGQAVISEGNIYGQVIEVAPQVATVMQLTDTNHTIPVRSTRNGMRALAVGSGQVNVLELDDIPANADIRKGDKFVSSGLGKLFPADYPVAEVTQVEYEPGDPFVTVKARTFANYDTARHVLLIWGDTSQKTEIKKATEVVPSLAPTENNDKQEEE